MNMPYKNHVFQCLSELILKQKMTSFHYNNVFVYDTKILC